MKKEELNSLLKNITPTLEKFTFSVFPVGNNALELISDAYSVFLVKNAENIMAEDLSSLTAIELSFYRKKLLNDILQEIYQLGVKSGDTYKGIKEAGSQFQSYYSLDLRMRTLLFLEYKLNYSEKDLMNFFNFTKTDLIELRFNAKKILLKSYESIMEVSQ